MTVAETKTRAHPKSSLDLPVTALPGVGGESEKLLERLEIHTIGDLLWHLPRTYHDFSKFVPVRALRAGKKQTVDYKMGDTIPDTARRAGLKPPFSCESGSCATCMAHLDAGAANMRVNNALTPEEVDDGWVLTCQSIPTSRAA